MTIDATSVNDDALAMAWLDRLLAGVPSDRPALLATLAHERPDLHPRVLRLLAAAEDDANSHLVHAPLAGSALGRIAPVQRAGRVVGGYRLIRELGRGGMSAVWLAERSEGPLTREVALKLPLFLLDDTAVRRFELERDVLAGLDHPGIAKLIDAAVAETGQPFFVLDYIRGEHLDAACNARRLGLRARLQMFLQVLQAVEHAHRHGVVHRDLKPSNILVDHDGRVRLLDFGIAKVLNASAEGGDAALTRLNDRPGTLRYAAPEQVEGGNITVATDVYSLGVVLFELLCGVAPCGDAARTPGELEFAVLHDPAPRPSQAATEDFAATCTDVAGVARWRAALRGDLDNIVLKALAKNPLARYASIERFIDDLQRFLEHRPVAARRPPVLHRIALLVRRNVAASSAAALGAAGVVLFAALAFSQYRSSMEERLRAEMVRDFMFDLVDDAEPDERHGTGAPTGRDMVEGAVSRAEARFSTQPRMLGELLAELARMQARLRDAAPRAVNGQADSLAGLQQRAVTLLEQTAPAGDAALNKARAYRADALLKDGDLEAAQALAQRAFGDCRRGAACAKARFYASNVLGRVEMLRGHPSAALDHMRDAVTDSEAGFGPKDSEAALALLAYAVTARQAGQLDLARDNLDRAIAVSQSLNLRRSDRNAIQLMRAVIDLDTGAYADARARLQQALAGNSLDEAARIRFQRVLATVELALDDAPAALATTNGILAQASAGLDATLALQARARAQGRLGACTQANADMAAALKGLQSLNYADRSMEVMRARRYDAEIQWRACDPARGLALLRQLALDQAAVKAGQEVEFGQTLSLLGVALRQNGEFDAALQAQRQAEAELQAKLPESHPIRRRNLDLLHAAEAASAARPASSQPH